jgi:hypothetical protein
MTHNNHLNKKHEVEMLNAVDTQIGDIFRPFSERQNDMAKN